MDGRPRHQNHAWGLRRLYKAGVLLSFAIPGTAPGHADIYHLRSGGSVSGKLIESTAEQYVIRTLVGTVRLPLDAVERIEEAPNPFDEYEARQAKLADQPAAHVKLGRWCREEGLREEARRHFRRAIELDPDFVPARAALGQVKVGDLWVDGDTVVKRTVTTKPSAEDAAKEQEQLARAIQGQWNLRIRAIKQSLLDSALERLVKDGRRKILEIRDPLAILPLAEVLSRGDRDCRALLVEALQAFPNDEATMNLAILALIDRDEEIRRRTLVELKRRRDPRVVAQYREALQSGNGFILRRAAEGLGSLAAVEAVPDLIEQLTVRQRQYVEVPTGHYLNGYPQIFQGTSVVQIAPGVRVVHWPQIGVWHPNFGTDSEYELKEVTVFRTEVLEALKKITGKNFGFERDAWRRWYEEQRP
jgi:hypothetical protein